MINPGRKTDWSGTLVAIARGLADGEATTRSPFARALARDKAFAADFGNLEITGGDFAALTLENPSTDVALVASGIITESSTTARPELLRNPTSDLPTTERPTRSLNFTGDENTTAAVARSDTQANEMAAGNGEETGIRLTVPPEYKRLPFRVVIGPGETLGISTGGNLDSETLDFTVLFHEKPAN